MICIVPKMYDDDFRPLPETFQRSELLSEFSGLLPQVRKLTRAIIADAGSHQLMFLIIIQVPNNGSNV